MLTPSQGEFLVRLARKYVEGFAEGKALPEEKMNEKWLCEKRGVFVSLHTYPGNDLRGCVGFPYPILPLGKAVCEASASACCDERFPAVSKREIGKTTIEVSVLSVPEEIKFKNPEELLKKLTKKEGLILRMGSSSGLFLPQVWKQIPEKKEFLDHLCLKAWLPPGAWKMHGARISSFNAQIFCEETPVGKVSGKTLL